MLTMIRAIDHNHYSPSAVDADIEQAKDDVQLAQRAWIRSESGIDSIMLSEAKELTVEQVRTATAKLEAFLPTMAAKMVFNLTPLTDFDIAADINIIVENSFLKAFTDHVEKIEKADEARREQRPSRERFTIGCWRRRCISLWAMP